MRLIPLFLLLLLTSCGDQQIPTLHIFAWSEMLDADLVHDFEESFDCRVIIDLYDSNESMYAKIRLGNSSYDIIFPSSYYLEIMQKQKMVHKLDFSLIPNHIYLDPLYFTKETSPYGIPFMVSYSGLGYRNDRVELPSPSYTIFNSSDYIGRMTMLNDAREALGAALKTLGYSINSINQNEVDEAADLLISWKWHLAKFENEQYKNGLINGEFLISQSYSSDILQVQRESQYVSFGFPKEGSILSIDLITVPIDAPNFELAHAFINFMLEPKAAATNIERTHALTPVIPSYELLPEELRTSPILFPSVEQRNNMEKIQDLGENISLYYEAWERVKGS